MTAVVAAPLLSHTFDCKLAGQHGDQLEEVFTATQTRAMQWRKDSTRALQLEIQQGVEELRRERVGLEELQAELQNAEQLTEAARKMKAEGSQLREVIRTSADAVARRAKVAQSTMDKLREVQGARQKELLREEEVLAEQCGAAKAQEAEIEGFLGLYRERLGLSISRAAPRTVRLAFTLLDEEDPAREFVLMLGIGERQGYRVFECSPHVPQVTALLERLNSSSGTPTALPAFVCGMRRAFQQVAGVAGATSQ